MEKYKKIGFSVLVVAVIVGLAVLIFRPKNNNKLDTATSESTVFSTKEDEQKSSPIEKVLLTSEQEETIATYENEQKILEVVHSFMAVFDNVSTKDYQEMMPHIYESMTEKAKETIVPFYEGDKNMDEITTKLVQEHSYISYEPNTNHARVISFVTKELSYNSDPTRYETPYILVHELVREQDNWKIDSRISQSTPATFSSQLFE